MIALAGKREHGLTEYFRMVCLTAVITFAVVAFAAGGPLGLLIGLPFAIPALALGVPLITIAGAPIWIGAWKLGRRFDWRDDSTAVFAALAIGLLWVAVAPMIQALLPSYQPHSGEDPIVLPGMLESSLAVVTQTAQVTLVVALFVAIFRYGEQRD